ncbi:hypothetical protein F4811DRAFT_532280 [Daldinia bambusicola]|nr:hypothetical protein F4811DRAFT_532280 [Daldinia bambusicola]
MPPPLAVRCTHGSSTSIAKSFVRLLCASSSSSPMSGSSNSSILEVLLPPPRARSFHLAARDIRSRARNLRTRNDGNLITHTGRYATANAHRHFSATAPWRKTMVMHNPQKDEDGNVMMLEITPRAATKLSQIMAKDKNPNLALRISVESGGCHGFQYLMSLTTLPPSLSSSPSSTRPHSPDTQELAKKQEQTAAEVAPSTTTSAAPSAPSLAEDDTVFAFVSDILPPSPSPPSSSPADPDSSAAQPPAPAPPSEPSVPSTVTELKDRLRARVALTPETIPKIVLDAPSLELLKGSKVDYTVELIGSQFKIVDNPLATSSCGCGTSFDIKI